MQAFTSHMSRMNQQTQVLAPGADHNPLLEEWSDPFGVPAFGHAVPGDVHVFGRRGHDVGVRQHVVETVYPGGNRLHTFLSLAVVVHSLCPAPQLIGSGV